MEAFAINGPYGIESASIRDTEAECWCDWVSTTWMDRDDSAMKGYRCVPVQVIEWLPIESAPKGQKLIIGYTNNNGKWRTVLAQYWLPDTLESDHTENGFADEGWHESTEAYEELAPIDYEPTHWMPLPPPPKEPK